MVDDDRERVIGLRRFSENDKLASIKTRLGRYRRRGSVSPCLGCSLGCFIHKLRMVHTRLTLKVSIMSETCAKLKSSDHSQLKLELFGGCRGRSTEMR